MYQLSPQSNTKTNIPCPAHDLPHSLKLAAPHLPSLFKVDQSPLEDREPMSIRKQAPSSTAYLLHYHRHPLGGRKYPLLALGTSMGETLRAEVVGRGCRHFCPTHSEFEGPAWPTCCLTLKWQASPSCPCMSSLANPQFCCQNSVKSPKGQPPSSPENQSSGALSSLPFKTPPQAQVHSHRDSPSWQCPASPGQ